MDGRGAAGGGGGGRGGAGGGGPAAPDAAALNNVLINHDRVRRTTDIPLFYGVKERDTITPQHEKFFNNCLATKINVPVPKTVILPSRDHPDDTTDQSFANLSYPLDWEGIFNYVGFPAYMKPFAGGGWKNVYKLESMDDFFEKHAETGQLVMLLQEEIIFEEYYRCYCIGGKHVRIMSYEPRNPHHLRYVADFKPTKKRLEEMEEIVLRINQYLGYDFNTVELAVRDGVPYAIDFCNPAPDADKNSVGEENFAWVVETAANFAIEKAKAHTPNADNLTWGEYIKRSSSKQVLY